MRSCRREGLQSSFDGHFAAFDVFNVLNGDDRRYFAHAVVAFRSMTPEPEEKSVEEGTFGGTKEKTVEEDTGDQGGGQN